MAFKDILVDSIESDILANQFICDPYSIYDSSVNPYLIDFKIDYEEVGNIVTKFRISFDCDLDDFSTGTTLKASANKIYNVTEMSSFIHDFTIEPIEMDTDVKLSYMFPLIDDGANHLTPDSIWRTTKGHYVLEYTTSGTTNVSSMEKTFAKKVASYSQALQNRLEKDKYIKFDVIVISPDSVITNCQYLTDSMIDELCYRYKMAVAINRQLVRDGITRSDVDDSETQNQKKIHDILASIRPSPSVKFMDESFLHQALKPCDRDSALKAVNDCMGKCVKKVNDRIKNIYQWDPDNHKAVGKTIQNKVSEMEEMIEKYEESVNENPLRSLFDKKSVIQLPFWVLNEGDGCISITSDNLNSESVGWSNDETFKVWLAAIQKLEMGLVSNNEEDEDLEMKIAMGEEQADPMQKGKFHRVSLEIDGSMKKELQKVGIFVDRKFQDEDIKELRRDKNNGFSLDVEVDDIDDFLENTKIWEDTETVLMKDSEILDTLMESSKLHGSEEASDISREVVESFLCTKMGRVSSFIADLATELCASIKQHCKKDQFVLKKLRHFDVYVLIKQTNSMKHLFFSLLAYNQDIEFSLSSPWKKFNSNGRVSWTEFVSVSQSKLVNLVMAESNIFASWCFHHHFFSVPIWQERNDYRVCKQTNLDTLIMLHDKSQVEEIITNMRYVMMEGFVSPPNIPNPHKMIEKLPIKIKSRLTSYIIRRCFDSIRRISNGYYFKPIDPEKPSDDMVWLNLFHPITGDRLDSPYQLINTFYIGYWKNKDETPQANTIGKMFIKILELEKDRPTKENVGETSKFEHELKYHEFNADFLKLICDHAGNYLRLSIGKDWKDVLDKEIRSKLAEADIESHSTLKATSNFGPDWYNPDVGKKYFRSKVIENLWKLADEQKTLMLELLPKSLSFLEENGESLFIDLFRKPQHGGLREIYVLTVEGRVVQLVLETISRVLCSKFSSETMTHPKNKVKIPENHAKVARKQFGSNFITMATSDDAKKWNQGHHVAKFAMMLCRLTKPLYHGIIIRGLRLWLNKKIMIPLELLKIFDCNPFLQSYDPYLARMNDCYRGRAEEIWMKRNSRYIQTETGMMQGILHYTSSLLHSILLQYYVDICRESGKNILRALDVKPNFIISTQQSSDDSSVLLTVNCQKDERVYAMALGSQLFDLKVYLSKLVGIYDSIKSTRLTLNVMEFNSEFFIYGNQFRPTSRWVSAVNRIPETEAFSARQEQMANLLTEVLEGGGSVYLCSLLQWSQGLLHYRLLGSSVNGLFFNYINALSLIKDPATGYFLMDHPMAAGLMGFKYNLWNVLMTNRTLSSKYKFMLQNMQEAIPKLKEKGIQYKTLETTTSGSFVNSILVTWGNRQKWNRMIERLNLPENWLTIINNNPWVLYKKPETRSELVLRIAAKIHSPGISESLSKGNAISRIMAASVYLISRNVVKDTSQWNLNEERRTQSLLKIALDDNKFLDGSVHEGLSKDELRMLFPFSADYHEIRENLMHFINFAGKKQLELPKKRGTNIRITESDGDYLLNPIQLVAWKWFGIDKLAAASRLKESSWNKLKENFNWLCDTPEETLKKSPFESQIQLQNFLSRLERKNRVVHLSGVAIKTNLGKSNLLTAIYQNFYPGFTLDPVFDEQKAETSRSSRQVLHCLFMICAMPLTMSRKQQLMKNIIRSTPILPWDENSARSRRNMLHIVQKHEQSCGKIEVLQKIFHNKLGIIGGYIKPQRSKYIDGNVVYYGKGIWLGCMDDVTVRIDVDSKDNMSYVTKVVLSSDTHVWATHKLIKSWLMDNNIISGIDIPSRDAAGFMNNQRIVMGPHGIGTPVYLNSNLRYVYDMDSIVSIDTIYRNFTINLRAKIKHGHEFKEHNILSVSMNQSDINMEIGRMIKFEEGFPVVAERWITGRSLKTSAARTLIDKTIDNESLRFTDLGENKIWVRDIIRESLRRKSLLPAAINLEQQSQTQVVTTEEQDRLNRMIQNDIEVGFVQGIDFSTIMMQMSTQPDVCNPLADDVYEGVDILNVMEIDPRSGPKSHPIFENYIRYLIEDISTRQLQKLLIEKKISKANRDYLKFAKFILNCGEELFTDSLSSSESDIEESDDLF
uniref:RNA-dependent RNA polymerase n=1 Tax=Wenling crustacean virus 7 TaxID=1923490 RepID=A0A1L3KPQ3_9VIRU|nr:RNA-dependent RNA polymerase [Wenling crustacean virus 7]